MKRRTFLYHASLGTLGFSALSGIPSRFFRSNFSASLDAFFKSVGARPQNWLESDPFLEAACQRASVSWEKIGYKPFSQKVFVYHKGSRAIYLLQLVHEKLGTLDISALFFEHTATVEKWQLITPLSGFQLEALVKGAEDLQSSYGPSRLANLLLPALLPDVKRTPGRFVTEAGEVSVKAIMDKSKAVNVTAVVYESGQAVWSSEYVSQYLQSL